MLPIDNRQRIEAIINSIIDTTSKFKYVGDNIWGDNSGSTGLLPTFEIESDRKKVWVSFVEWISNSRFKNERKVNRVGILCTLLNEKNRSLGQTFTLNIPFKFSKRFSTRVYGDENNIEIRHYGRFTIGKRGLKKETFLLIYQKMVIMKKFYMTKKITNMCAF